MLEVRCYKDDVIKMMLKSPSKTNVKTLNSKNLNQSKNFKNILLKTSDFQLPTSIQFQYFWRLK